MLQGLDVLESKGFARLRGRRIGVVCNQASIDRGARHILDLFLDSGLDVRCVFGPQHGIWGHTQDDMIEWQGYTDPRTGLPFYSLYGERRKPAPEQLAGLDLLVIDLQEVGARYYTFLWTLAHCMAACEEFGLPILVLDRANPIGGQAVEGTVLDPTYASFVGLHPLPMRHGMTIGEVAVYLRNCFYKRVELEVVPCEDWGRHEFVDSSRRFWAPPSPNMPTADTALVYPGACLLEGTNLSEGRGTTRPFEMVGAPFLDGWKLAGALDTYRLRGAMFRPITFEPTFHKWVGEPCGGVFVHVSDRVDFKPVATYVAILIEAAKLSSGKFMWKEPPYEYETEKLPFDILAGNAWLRAAIEEGQPLELIVDRMESEVRLFAPLREEALIYR